MSSPYPPTLYGVSLETTQADAAPLLDLLREQWHVEPVEVLAHGQDRMWIEIYFPEEVQALLAVASLRPLPGVRSATLRTTHPEDWQTMFRRHFSTRAIGTKLRVAPVWERDQLPQDGRCTVLVEPGLGFGTGEHFTTRFCLEQMDRIWSTEAPASFLDIGTGSGILAAAAARLGCARVVATDHAADALRSAAENLALNEVADRVELLAADVEADPLPGRFDVVCANLYANLLRDCARRIAGATARWLLVSGLREEEADPVAEAFQHLGGSEVGRDGNGEWAGLVFRFNLSPPPAIRPLHATEGLMLPGESTAS